MPPKIATVRAFENAAEVVVRIWEGSGKSKLLRMEGFDGVGKSGLAKLVAERIGAGHVEGDKFVSKPNVPKAYPECIRKHEFDASVSSALAMDKPTILDAVCLDQVAPSGRWGRGFVVYVKRLSFNNKNPIWHEGFNLEDEKAPFLGEPYHGIFLYHQTYKPHERADLIIELPESGHVISNFAFDRSNCFDPAEAEVVFSNV